VIEPSKEIRLEERIERILRAKELELDGEAYVGKYELNDRKSIMDFLKKISKNNEDRHIVYKNPFTAEEIIISGKSIKKLIDSSLHEGELFKKSLAHIPQIIENMQFLENTSTEKQSGKKGYDNYSYYVTQTKIDGMPYTILSTIGRNENSVYYDQNVFKGTPKEVFANAINGTNNPKYSRLIEILQKAKEEGWDPIQLQSRETPTSLY
jgi:hypothetical protein